MRTKKSLLAIINLLFALTLTACHSPSTMPNPTTNKSLAHASSNPSKSNLTSTNKDSKEMIIYFSATKNTEKIATKIHNLLGAQLYQILPAKPYSSDDLNWHNDTSRANKEQNDNTARPEISTPLPDLNHVNTLYLGTPLWWGKAPRIIQTFIEHANLSGKTVYLFCTSGSSPVEPAIQLLKTAYLTINWQNAHRFETTATDSNIAAWIQSLPKKEA